MASVIFRKPIILTAVAVSTAVGVGGYVWVNEHRPPILEVHVFSLKNNNSIFIRTPDDRRILIKGGSNSEVIRHIGKVLPFYSKRIDTVIATNTEKKNIGGLIGIVERYSVGQVIVPAITLENLGISSSTDNIYSEFLKSLRAEKISFREVVGGEKIIFDDISRSKITAGVLFPVSPENFSYSKSSSPEIIMNISYGLTNILIAGDSSNKIQRYIASSTRSIDSNITIPVDVLVVSHSALPSNMNQQFLETLQPEFLIYSQILAKPVGISLFPSDKRFNAKEKTIKIISDGKSVKVSKDLGSIYIS